MKNAISTADGDGDGKTDDLDDELVVRPGGGMPPLTVIHPRSRWMRGEVQRPAYMDMAAAADWSGHAGVDAMEAFTGELGRLLARRRLLSSWTVARRRPRLGMGFE